MTRCFSPNPTNQLSVSHPCTVRVPSVYRPCTVRVPSVYRPCTVRVPSVREKAMRIWLFSCCLFILSLLTCHAANELVTVGRCSAPPVIDGKLDDVAWQNSLEISNFIKHKSRGQAPSRHSQVFLTYDDEYLYIGIRCYEEMLHPVLNQTELFRAKATRHDDPQIWRDDLVEIFLAPDYNNPAHYYQLAVNSNGAIWDTITTKQPDSWNASAKSAGNIFVDETRPRPDNAGWRPAYLAAGALYRVARRHYLHKAGTRKCVLRPAMSYGPQHQLRCGQPGQSRILCHRHQCNRLPDCPERLTFPG